MALPKLKWDSVEFRASDVKGWVAFRGAVSLGSHPILLSPRAVYVIRIKRPYAFSYGEDYSPVAYIGKGQAQKRITSHLKSWIPKLAEKIPDLKVKIFFCEPRVQWHGTICEHVEADLIYIFQQTYGAIPLRNRVCPGVWGEHYYDPKDLHVLHPGKGKGFHWAIRPLPSCHFYR